MPLVMEEMGTSSTGVCGHRSCHMLRATRPCKALTPLALPARFRASTAMEKLSSAGAPARRPSCKN